MLQQTDQDNDDLLGKKPVVSLRIDNATVEDTFVQLLKAARIPGGLALAARTTQTSYSFNFENTTMKEALERLVGSDDIYAWRYEQGAIYLFPKGLPPKFLDVHIAAFKAGPSPIDGLLGHLVDLPEIRVARSNLKLHPARFLGGLYSPQPRLISVDLRDVTLAEALNAIAAKHGSAIWQYAEDKDGEYSLLFVSR
ncbi:MAG TPA: hypothetical protein VFK06_12965 [Candidatus Angelobacter sp.]|nr:hypothetical protein [Candidatus Angelobacter sp.]